ncbi:MAG TPA: trehalose-6-phosphate synthase, partial [Candidatus Limnocylindrales bacterium]
GREGDRVATTGADRRAAPTRADLLDDLLGPGGRLVVVSNRGPVTFERDDAAPGALTATRGSGGLVTALGELGRHAPVTWVAAAMTDGDRDAGAALAPRGKARTRRHVETLIDEALPGQDMDLRYESIPPDVFDGYYGKLSNPFLWFVQHQMYASVYGPNVDAELMDAWRSYEAANRLLAEAAADAAGPGRPVVLLQDYHLYVAAARIRELRPDATILHFTHIPWPAASQWQLIPQRIRRGICEGLLAADIVGLQTDRYASHFLDTVASFVADARVEADSRNVRWRGRRVRVRSYPISVDPDGLVAFAGSEAVTQQVERFRERLARAGSPRVIVRADRLEPSKNALRGYLAFEALLLRRPDLRATVRFVAVQAATRTDIAEYAAYGAAVREVVARINGMGDPDEQPVWLYDGSDYATAIAALRLADVVLVNPIVDGMNLVAKEAVLVAERDPALILSETAGAAEQMASATITVAPADVVGTAAALERGLEMPRDERRRRVADLRRSVRHEDLDWWLTRQLRDLVAVRAGVRPPSRRLRDAMRRGEREAGG